MPPHTTGCATLLEKAGLIDHQNSIIRRQRLDDIIPHEVAQLAAERRRRFGHRRLGYLLAREGMAPNHKKLLRIYRG